MVHNIRVDNPYDDMAAEFPKRGKIQAIRLHSFFSNDKANLEGPHKIQHFIGKNHKTLADAVEKCVEAHQTEVATHLSHGQLSEKDADKIKKAETERYQAKMQLARDAFNKKLQESTHANSATVHKPLAK